MQLSLTTDYAIRTVITLAKSEDIMTAERISEEVGVLVGYLVKVLKKLEKAGLVKVIRGRNGGYSIKKPPEDISLYDVMEVMEPTTKINRCLEEDSFCSRDASGKCAVRQVYKDIQSQLDEELKKRTIKEILEK